MLFRKLSESMAGFRAAHTARTFGEYSECTGVRANVPKRPVEEAAAVRCVPVQDLELHEVH